MVTNIRMYASVRGTKITNKHMRHTLEQKANKRRNSGYKAASTLAHPKLLKTLASIKWDVDPSTSNMYVYVCVMLGRENRSKRRKKRKKWQKSITGWALELNRKVFCSRRRLARRKSKSAWKLNDGPHFKENRKVEEWESVRYAIVYPTTKCQLFVFAGCSGCAWLFMLCAIYYIIGGGILMAMRQREPLLGDGIFIWWKHFWGVCTPSHTKCIYKLLVFVWPLYLSWCIPLLPDAKLLSIHLSRYNPRTWIPVICVSVMGFGRSIGRSALFLHLDVHRQYYVVQQISCGSFFFEICPILPPCSWPLQINIQFDTCIGREKNVFFSNNNLF